MDNYIGIEDEAFDMFGKVMSTPDRLMPEYFQYLANLSPEDCAHWEGVLAREEVHPNEAKKQLATRVVALFHGEEEAQEQRRQFERVFAQKKVPDHIPSHHYAAGETLLDVMVNSNQLPSKSEAGEWFNRGV